jgi:hypothetical protein
MYDLFMRERRANVNDIPMHARTSHDASSA